MMRPNDGLDDQAVVVALEAESAGLDERADAGTADDPRALPAAVKARIAAYSSRLRFWLNGRPCEIENPDPTTVLSDHVRDSGLTGTKVGCGQGGCGACTVMISRRTPEGDDHRAINACLRSLAALADTHVTT